MRQSCLIALTLGLLGPAAAAGDIYNITLEGMDFVYEGQANADIDLSVNLGDTVRWTWVSGFHNVVSGSPDDADAGSLFESGPPTGVAGTTFEFTFTELGVVDYFCQVHGSMGMVSQITVVPAPAALALLAPLGLAAARRRR